MLIDNIRSQVEKKIIVSSSTWEEKWKKEIDRCRRDILPLKAEDELRSKPTNFWKYINKFRKYSKHITDVGVGGAVISNPWVICNKFEEYFAYVYQKPDQNDLISDLMIAVIFWLLIIIKCNQYLYYWSAISDKGSEGEDGG